MNPAGTPAPDSPAVPAATPGPAPDGPPIPGLQRFGAVSGVLLALGLGVPGAVEAFTGETAATSIVLGLGAAFGAPAVTAFHAHQAAASGRFGVLAHAVNLVGLGLFTGVAFALNLVVYFLHPAALPAPTRAAVLAAAAVFIAGTVLFGVSMARSGVFPQSAAWGYTVCLTLLALASSLPDTPWTGLLHVLAAASLVRLSVAVWPEPRPSA
ncbi:hypothetical protein [Streptomyces sp. NPDC086023]|uniref:hypothetical protein n=1 Tax=Streptomyces sp. NPDC086023 TaxID=3365746 RepID=UPI0037CED0D3